MSYNNTYEQEHVTAHENTNMEGSDENEELITHDQMIFIMRILMFGVTPAISILGIVGNIFSIIILLKQGLHKCSNILLISLAVADLSYLVAFNSVPKILYEVVGVESGYGYSRPLSLILIVLYFITNILDYAGSYISFTFPMIITFERLFAVYLPLKFNLIVTPKRTWCVVAFVYVFWYALTVYMNLWYTFSYTFDPSYNISVGQMVRSSYFYNHDNAVNALNMFTDYAMVKIPPAVTLVGSILIGVKVSMATRQRQKMTQKNSKESSSNRTTKMLLAVCVIYMITCAIISLPLYLPQLLAITLYGDAPTNLSPVVYQVLNIAICINSSANFVVYVGLNKNFRDTYKSLFTSAENRDGKTRCSSILCHIKKMCDKGRVD